MIFCMHILYHFISIFATLILHRLFVLLTFADFESKSNFREKIEKTMKNKSYRGKISWRPRWIQRASKNQCINWRRLEKFQKIIQKKDNESAILTANPSLTSQKRWSVCTSYFLSQNKSYIVVNSEIAVLYRSIVNQSRLMMWFF